MARTYFVGDKEFFPGIGKIAYEGPASDNALAFKFYDPDKKIGGRTMREHLRFAIAYWHSFCADGTDPFGRASHAFPWSHQDPMTGAKYKAQAAFEFFTKIGAPYYCFHDADVAPEGETVDEYQKNYWDIARLFKDLQKETGVKLLWNTANLFSHPRYMNGGATNPDFNVVARAAIQVQTCLDVNVFLKGEGYTFWGGREGYMSLLNTDMKREQEHMGTFLRMARDYGRKIGFSGPFYIEPKPMEPTKHQYDYDAATAIAFIRSQGLEKDFRLNIENNHATLAGHSFAHELQVAADAGLFGSVDANQGDMQNGWDTDEFPYDVYQTVEAMMVILKTGGFTAGGLNFDAKRRRNSTDMEDLFIAHILGFDAFALGLEVASRIIDDGRLDELLQGRYASFDTGAGADFEKGSLNLEQLADLGRSARIEPVSGKQEYLQGLVNQYMFG